MADPVLLEQTRAACCDALEQAEDLQPLWRMFRETGSGAAGPQAARALLPEVRPGGSAVRNLATIKEALARAGHPVGGGAFERFLVVDAARNAVDRLEALPVDDRVKDLFCRNFQAYAAGRTPELFDLSNTSFVAIARIATLSRFPAGQLDWEVSGLPRSWLFKVPPLQLPRLTAALAFELRGFGPTYFSHLSYGRRNQGFLLERESLRSYHRMARSMMRQPEIRGFITASWFHSPDTFAVSPHLEWLNKVFLQNGGHVFSLGRADVESGVLHRSPERQQAYAAGTFKPTEALIVWPRKAMLAWAADHEELRDDRAGRVLNLSAQGAHP